MARKIGHPFIRSVSSSDHKTTEIKAAPARYSVTKDETFSQGQFRVWDTQAIVTLSAHDTEAQAKAAIRRYEAADVRRGA